MVIKADRAVGFGRRRRRGELGSAGGEEQGDAGADDTAKLGKSAGKPCLFALAPWDLGDEAVERRERG